MRTAMTDEERDQAPEGATEIALKAFGNLQGGDWYTETLLQTHGGRFFFAVDSGTSSIHNGASFEQWVSDDEASNWLQKHGFTNERRRYFPIG